MLWLALHLRQLALEVFPPIDSPAVVVQQHLVIAANAAASACGIQAGIRLALALGLAPQLGVHERATPREAVALHQLACWAGQFTPHVCVAGDDELLLEIGGCLRLFDGLEKLCRGVYEGAIEQGFTPCMAVAPTPLAAQWMARASDAKGIPVCRTPTTLRERLTALPLAVISLPAAQASTLQTLGVQNLADLFALPAAGLARRFGPALPACIAQALGESPDPRPGFVFPESFALRLELTAKVSATDMLLFAARRMLAALVGWLAQRAAGISQCTLRLEHDDDLPDSVLVLAFASPTRDLARMQRVLQERLNHFPLPAPTEWLSLHADAPQTLAGHTIGMFGESSGSALEPVIERLRARLGADAVHGLAVRAEHRPECSSAPTTRAEPLPLSAGPPRPLWLLPKPRSLPDIKGRPSHGGALLRLAGPERIESGWWDAAEQGKPGDVRRDYYVAVSPQGEWLWIFRDGGGWWLQGLFA